MNIRVLLPTGALLLGAWVTSRAIRTARYTLRDKAVVITGGSRGLGLVLARHICAQGGNVALIARDPDELARAKADLAPRGGMVLTIECDLLDPAQIGAAVRQAIDRFGKIDILINNAGIIEVGPLENMTREDFERAMRLHFWAPFELIAQVVPEMRIWGGGRIVNISSIGGKVAVPHLAQICADRLFRCDSRRARARQHSCDDGRARNDADRIPCECKIQRQARHGVCMVRCFGRGAVDLDEC
jgi:NAD(P)-dependent dehydrogenase (short-subunit alcohol dehydrogenase family)